MRNRIGDALSVVEDFCWRVQRCWRWRTPVVVGILHAPRLRAQTLSGGGCGPAFEVASVKPNKSGDGDSRLGIQPGGRFIATNVSLRMLIRSAYQLQEFQIVGGPGWIDSERFDIMAKAEGDFPPPVPADRPARCS